MLNKRQKLLLKWGVLGVMGIFATLLFLVMRPKPIDPSALQNGQKVEGLTHVLDKNLDTKLVTLRFSERSKQAGINFKHFNDTRHSLLPEDMGSGVAFGDFNNDGLVDIYVVNFAHSIDLPLQVIADLSQQKSSGKLYKNLGNGTFEDVTQTAGLLQQQFGMGASWGDYDNDGWLDLYLTHYGKNQLFHNDGNGHFVDVSKMANVEGVNITTGEFSSGSTWGDYDKDGWIDLYVSNYVDYQRHLVSDPGLNKQNSMDVSYQLNPSTYQPQANILYHNNGDGTFTNVAKQAGVDNISGRSMGAMWLDFNNDGWPDLYVANDVSANGVFLNLGQGHFQDIGASSLAADYRGAMGLASGDIDNDSDPEIFVTHWLAQENAFFMNMSADGLEDKNGKWRLFFMDDADNLGLGQISLKTVGWATGLSDFDNDGLLDLWVVNGDTLEETIDHVPTLKAQPMHLFQNQTKQGFFEVGQIALGDALPNFVGRGGASADFNQDGLVDLAVQGQSGTLRLLQNTAAQTNQWVGLQLRQKQHNRFALGARVEVIMGAEHHFLQTGAENSYLSQNEDILHIGLGQHTKIDTVKVNWPDGQTSETHDLAANQLHVLYHEDKYE